VLAGDDSASDRLVISGGTASGVSTIQVNNLGGAGAATTGNGIALVTTSNGGTTATTAFAIDRAIAAGPYEYLLFRGGTTAGTENNWYLRNNIIAAAPLPATPVTFDPAPPSPQPPDPSPPAQPPAPPPFVAPTTITPQVIEAAATAPEPIPLYRPEAAVYSAVPAIARQSALLIAGTFNDRQGDQRLQGGEGFLSSAWGRALGQRTEQHWSGDVAPAFDGDVSGLQAGLALFGRESSSGSHDEAGIFFGYVRASGNVRGFALAQPDIGVGSLELESDSAGAYWTHVDSPDWYTDVLVVRSSFEGEARSLRGLGMDLGGNALTASVETGHPFAIGRNLLLEPQAQVLFQRLSLDGGEDVFSSVRFHREDSWIARVGVRLVGAVEGALQIHPYLQANLWHTLDGNDTVEFSSVPVQTQRGATALEFAAGLAAATSDHFGMYAALGYTTDLDSDRHAVLSGNPGIRIAW